eukprot:TRINITY_DN14848_c0_g1_i1.p1 TRINITY_DN14848_c0_g1~~TRINITY_DN14848_c0_g1_i1.p1  ORF type:complete len:551 (+),score=166.12 TRINITY_DN14848_c0_g1_i1:632-2284(+)
MNIIEKCSTEVSKIFIDGLPIGKRGFTMDLYQKLMIQAIIKNRTHGEETFLFLWDKLTNEQKMYRNTGKVRRTFLSQILEHGKQLSAETVKRLLEGMPAEFGQTHYVKKKAHISLGPVSRSFVPAVRELLNDFLGSTNRRSYTLTSRIFTKPHFMSAKKLMNKVLDRIAIKVDDGYETDPDSDAEDDLYNSYDYGAYSDEDYPDAGWVYRHFLLLLVRNYDYVAPCFCDMLRSRSDFVDGYEDLVYELLLLLWQGAEAPRVELLEKVVDWHNRGEYILNSPFCDMSKRFTFVFDCCAGLCNGATVFEIMKTMHCVSPQRVDELLGHDPFLVHAIHEMFDNFDQSCAFNPRTVNRELFMKKRRVETYIRVADEKRKKNDLVGASEFYWRSVLSSIEFTRNHTKHLKMADWCEMVASLQKDKKFEEAIHICDAALLIENKNRDRFVLLHARGKLARQVRDMEMAAQYFEGCLQLKPTLPAALFEAGISQGQLAQEENSARLFIECLKHDPNHTLAKKALKKLIFEAENYEELKKTAELKALFTENELKELYI